MSTVLFSCGKREWYRRTIVSEGELFCNPRMTDGKENEVGPGWGEYDVAAVLGAFPAPWRDPSLVVVHFDGEGRSVARNLAGVRCPRILIVGDTHHMSTPIRRPLEHALQERYDLVVLEYDRHHLHFFVEAGVERVGWLPAFSLTGFEHPAGGAKKYGITFAGGLDRHPNRQHVLSNLKRMGVQFQLWTGPQKDVAQVFSESQINLNISMNGDLNLRVFEVMAAGGFLVSDRLSPESGLEMLFEDRRDLVLFNDVGEARELITYYEAHPSEAELIAAAGQAAYLRRHRPEIKRAELLSMLNGKGPPEYEPRLDRRAGLPREEHGPLMRRIALYETLQELHRVNERLEVLFWSGMERAATDAVDLQRFGAWVVRDEGAPVVSPGPIESCGLSGRVRSISRTAQAMEKLRWNAVVCPVAELGDELLRHGTELRRWDLVILPDYEEAKHGVMVRGLAMSWGMSPVAADPMVLGCGEVINRAGQA